RSHADARRTRPAVPTLRRADPARPPWPWLPAALRVPLIDLVHGDAGHRGAEAPTDLGEDVGVAEMGRRFDDGLGTRRGIIALEDSRPDEHCFSAQLHR